MASSALEAKINKIRQQNEEIRRRYEEVEEDKKNAAKLNALVQMVPSSDWPERKEPPEFSNPPKAKQKPAKEKHEYVSQSHPVEGKKIHSFAQGEGPPPDPKYNFLADSEREEPSVEYVKESSGNRTHNKIARGNFRKKIGDRESTFKNNKVHKGNYRDESQPGYDAWRAERNRIDEDRISRQRTAEGNWRREWDNDKVHIIDDTQKNSSRPILGNFVKKDHKDSDRKYHANNNEHANHARGGSRPHRGSSKNFYSSYDNRSHNTYDQHRNNTAMPAKVPLSPTSEERTVVATDKSIKVIVNQANATKGPVMSVKVNSPSIAGTGRVGPRQRTRVTYSHSDAEVPMSEGESFHRQKSFEDKSKGTYYNNQKSPNVKRSLSQKKKEGDSKYPYQRKETKKEDNDTNTHRHHDNEFRSYGQKDSQKFYSNKSPKPTRGNMKATKQDSSNVNSSEKYEIQECSNLDSTKLENNGTKNNEILKLVSADQGEIPIIENEDVNTKDEITNETMLEEEIGECSLISLSGAENSNIENEEVNMKDEITDETTLKTEIEESSLISLSGTENSNIEYEQVNTKDEITNVTTLEKEIEESSLISLPGTENRNIENEEVNTKDEITNETSLLSTENPNIENKEVNMKDEITNETTVEKETEESSLISLSGTENPEPITKEDTVKNNFGNKNECSQEFVTTVTENLQESSDKSSEALVPNDIESEKELVPNESNNVPDDIVKLEEAPLSTDDQQSSKQVSEQFVNDHCDNIKDKVTEQRSTQVTTDHVSSLEAETHSVIKVKNQLICSGESVKEDISVAKEKTDESNECSRKDLKDVTEKRNNGEESITEESKGKSGELEDNKQEL